MEVEQTMILSRKYVKSMVLIVGVVMSSPAMGKKTIPISIGSMTKAKSSFQNVQKTFSVGSPQVGALLNAIPLTAGTAFTIRPKRNYGTPELVDVLDAAGQDVLARFPKSPRLYVGDLSYAHGGPIGRHVSHQSGRDADVAYYLKKGHSSKRFKHATAKNLDVGRTWALLESLLKSGHTQMIFSDRRLLKVLRHHAENVARVDKTLLRRWFDGDQTTPGQRPLLRHLKGHQNHFHLRVYAPQSEVGVDELGGGQLEAKARETLAAAHAFRGSVSHHDHGHHTVHQTATLPEPTIVTTTTPLVQHPEMNPGFTSKELATLMATTEQRGQSPALKARERARRARKRAHQARRRASRARVRWYQRHPERLSYQ